MRGSLPPTLLLTGMLALAVFPVSSHAADPSPSDLIDRLLAACGGRGPVERAANYRMEGRVVSKALGTEGPMTRVFSRPDRLRVVLDYPGAAEVRILDGAKGWRTGKDGLPKEVDGFLLSSMKLQAARADLAFLFDHRRSEVRPAAPHSAGGRTYPGLEMTLAPGMLVRVYLDPDTGLIARSQAVLNADPMRTHFETDYSDYRRIDGVMFPFREENFASGVHSGTTVIEKVEVNPVLSGDDFKPR